MESEFTINGVNVPLAGVDNKKKQIMAQAMADSLKQSASKEEEVKLDDNKVVAKMVVTARPDGLIQIVSRLFSACPSTTYKLTLMLEKT